MSEKYIQPDVGHTEQAKEETEARQHKDPKNEMLIQMIKSNDAKFARALAESENLSPDVIEALIATGDDETVLAVSENRSTPVAVLEELLKKIIKTMEALSKEDLRGSHHYYEHEMCEKLMKNPHISAEIQKSIAEKHVGQFNKSEFAKKLIKGLAQNECISEDALGIMMSNWEIVHPWIQRELACNYGKAISPEVLDELVERDDVMASFYSCNVVFPISIRHDAAPKTLVKIINKVSDARKSAYAAFDKKQKDEYAKDKGEFTDVLIADDLWGACTQAERNLEKQLEKDKGMDPQEYMKKYGITKEDYDKFVAPLLAGPKK